MNQVFCVRIETFKTCEAVSILENIPEEGITRLPPVKPKAGEAFLYLNDESKNGMLGSCSLRKSLCITRLITFNPLFSVVHSRSLPSTCSAYQIHVITIPFCDLYLKSSVNLFRSVKYTQPYKHMLKSLQNSN